MDRQIPASAGKTILDAKLLMDLLLMLPFYILSEGMLIAALSPSPLELLRMVLAPGAVMLFSCVYGITVNLALPSLDWKDEVTVVKQSGAAALGGMGGSLLALIWGAGGAFVPGGWAMTVDLVFCVVLLGVTAMLYARNNRTRLENID